jgi:hypothetical protein
MLQILPGTQIEPGRNQSPVRQLKTNSVRSRSQSYGAYKPTCTWSRIVPSCTCRLPSCVSLTGKTRTNHRHRGFWSRSKKWRCWEDERGRGCRSQRRSRRGSRAAGSAAAGHGEGSVGALGGRAQPRPPLPVTEKEPSGSSAAAAAAAGACAEAPGRANKGGLEVRRLGDSLRPRRRCFNAMCETGRSETNRRVRFCVRWW